MVNGAVGKAFKVAFEQHKQDRARQRSLSMAFEKEPASTASPLVVSLDQGQGVDPNTAMAHIEAGFSASGWSTPRAVSDTKARPVPATSLARTFSATAASPSVPQRSVPTPDTRPTGENTVLEERIPPPRQRPPLQTMPVPVASDKKTEWRSRTVVSAPDHLSNFPTAAQTLTPQMPTPSVLNLANPVARTTLQNNSAVSPAAERREGVRPQCPATPPQRSEPPKPLMRLTPAVCPPNQTEADIVVSEVTAFGADSNFLSCESQALQPLRPSSLEEMRHEQGQEQRQKAGVPPEERSTLGQAEHLELETAKEAEAGAEVCEVPAPWLAKSSQQPLEVLAAVEESSAPKAAATHWSTESLGNLAAAVIQKEITAFMPVPTPTAALNAKEATVAVKQLVTVGEASNCNVACAVPDQTVVSVVASPSASSSSTMDETALAPATLPESAKADQIEATGVDAAVMLLLPTLKRMPSKSCSDMQTTQSTALVKVAVPVCLSIGDLRPGQRGFHLRANVSWHASRSWLVVCLWS